MKKPTSRLSQETAPPETDGAQHKTRVSGTGPLAPSFDAAWRLGREDFNRGVPEQAERLAEALLADAVRTQASDIHFDSHTEVVQVRFRIDGVLHEAFRLPAREGSRMIRFFKTAAQLDPGPLLTPQDARTHFDLDGRMIELRIGCAPAIAGEKLAMRLLMKDPLAMTLGDLGLAAPQRGLIDHWIHSVSGMFLASGPIGTGKTTTLYALLSKLDLAHRNVVTIEDPVEYQLDGITQIQLDERHDMRMNNMLKTVLRLDPDYILVGEIRDVESARAAVEAASTGRVILSTLHARDAAGTVTSLRNLGVHDHEIAASLSFIVAQRLARRLCTSCRKLGKVNEPDRRWLDHRQLQAPDKVWLATGCPRCNGTGYTGRTGIFELWPVDGKGYELLLQGADEHAIGRHIREVTGSNLLDDGLSKASEGLTTLSELRGMSGLLRS